MGEELGIASPESKLGAGVVSSPLLLQLRSDRRLGHEWDDWDGEPLPNGGVFDASEGLFYQLAGALVVAAAGGVGGLLWLVGPRLGTLASSLDRYLLVAILAVTVLWLLWLGAVAMVIRTGRNWLPERLAERGLVPWLMPKLEAAAEMLGISRDRSGNAMLRVYNRLLIARRRAGVTPEELLILLPRCLGKEAMQTAMGVSARYGVPLFVAARGRYARQMIALRRPKGVVAVACERDLVSGVHDVARKLPVLGTTLRLADGPCRNTELSANELEQQVRVMLGLGYG
jgi:hypothetical protein